MHTIQLFLLQNMRLLTTDLGSAKSKITFLQSMLHHYHSDSLSDCNSHCYGKSTSNQVKRIIILTAHRVLNSCVLYLAYRSLLVPVKASFYGMVDRCFQGINK